MAKYDVMLEVWITTHGESKQSAVFRAREAITEGLPHALVRTTRTVSVEEAVHPMSSVSGACASPAASSE